MINYFNNKILCLLRSNIWAVSVPRSGINRKTTESQIEWVKKYGVSYKYGVLVSGDNLSLEIFLINCFTILNAYISYFMAN